MKIKIAFLSLVFLLSYNVKAQTYVTIPDADFVTWLQSNYATCMNGNQLDITCQSVQEETFINLFSSSISDLTGIEYFINLEELICSYNQLTELPSLPNSLKILSCQNNDLTSLPNLPPLLESLSCSANELDSLPTLPASLLTLYCANNNLTTLPALPPFLTGLGCGENNLIHLPLLPETLQTLNCMIGPLISLPELPTSLTSLNCSSNNITCFDFFPETLTSLGINGNSHTCLPNYSAALNSVQLAYPLCFEGDTVNNPYGCTGSSSGISGNLYLDSNMTCELENGESGLLNLAVKLYDTEHNLLSTRFSLHNGLYQFSIDQGNYIIEIDTTYIPFKVQCFDEDSDTLVSLTAIDPFQSGINFPLMCKPGFDLGIQSVLTNGWVFPGQNHEIQILAGDMSQWYNWNCASGISGEIQVSVFGPVIYQNPASGALTPNVSGNVFTYTISDFGTLDFLNSLGLIFKTDTTAQTGDEICVTVDINPGTGDNNISNNHFEYCYTVINSYDPNMKEVYPVNVEPGFEDYFTYTIHFQNTGSAPAFNIRLSDTLDLNLDLETFQVTNYSHYNSASLSNNLLTFHFPNIMLADSTTDLEGSKGYVQYRIKPKANLPLGTEIRNTANIYFDFNEPIITNTTINTFVENTSSLIEKENLKLKVYPNPFSSQTTIQFGETLVNAELMVYNVFGQKVKSISHINGNKLVLDRENLTNGIYFVKLISAKTESQTIKLIIKD